MPTENVLEVHHLAKEVGQGDSQLSILTGVELVVKPAQTLALIGESGSGKSTLLGILAGLDDGTSGEVSLLGQRLDQMDEEQRAALRARDVGFVFQSFHLINSLNVLDNVELPLLYRKVSAKERRHLAEEVLAKVGLSHRMRHMPTQLSGGQCQRVAIARAIIGNPEIILADEPTGNLDSKSTIEIMNILKDLHESGRTVIIITHDDEIANQVDRVVRIMDGKIVSDSLNP